MKRTTKRYVVTSDTLNCYGFRVITAGGDISKYANNPVLLWMHLRATGSTTNQILPLGNGVDLVFEGVADNTKLWCYLQFDDTDPFAIQIANKYENGTLNMLSLGAKPLEWSDDPADKVPGQTGITVTKWELVEISCVDIGGNPDAFGVQLYDADDNKINMADFNSEKFIKLFKPQQTAGTSNIYLTSKVKHDADTVAIVQNAVNAGKFDNKFATTLLALSNDETGVNTIFQFVKTAKCDPQKLPVKISRFLEPQLAMSYDEIYRNISGGFLELKEQAPEVYKAKYFEKHGRLPFMGTLQ